MSYFTDALHAHCTSDCWYKWHPNCQEIETWETAEYFTLIHLNALLNSSKKTSLSPSKDSFDFVVALHFTKPILKAVILGKSNMATIFS